MSKEMRTFSNAEIDRAVRHIKTTAPELWKTLVIRERSGGGIMDIGGEISALAKEAVDVSSLRELSGLVLRVRWVAYSEARARPPAWP